MWLFPSSFPPSREGPPLPATAHSPSLQLWHLPLGLGGGGEAGVNSLLPLHGECDVLELMSQFSLSPN